MRGLFLRVLTHPLHTLGLILLLTAALASQAIRVSVDNTPAAWLPSHDAEADTYRAFRTRFGPDTFVLCATGPIDLREAEVRRELVALQQELATLPGVVATHGPLHTESRSARARAGLDQELATLAEAVALEPADPELRLLQAEANTSLAFLLEDPGPAAEPRYALAQEAALAALAASQPELAAALAQGHAFAPPPALDDQAVAALFWWAFARGAHIRLRARDPRLLKDLGRIDEAMAWVRERDPTLFDAGPHLYSAVRHASLGRNLGGDPQAARAAFAAVERLTDGRALLPFVLQAELLAPALAATPAGTPLQGILAAQRAAWEAFRDPLLRVLDAPGSLPGDPPRRRLANAIARERAAAALSDPGSAGIIPPAAGEPPPAAAQPWPALDDGIPARFLRSADGTRAGLIVIPEADLDPFARAAFVAQVEARLAASSLDFRLAGPEAITHDLDAGSQTSFGLLFPVVLLAMGALLRWALGSLRVVLAILLNAGLASAWTLGLLVLAGRTLNLILVVIPAILAVLTTAYALHLVSRFLYPSEGAPAENLDLRARRRAWVDAARETFPPCLLTALTTAAGFASLGISEIPPVRDLGIFVAAGALIAFGLTFSFLPALLVLSARVLPRPRAVAAGFWSAARARAFVAWVARHRRVILGLTLLLCLGAAWGLRQLRFESHVLRFFPPEQRLPQAYADLEARLLGLTPLELWLEGPQEQVLGAETLAALDPYLARIRAEPLVTQVISPLAALPEGLGPRARAALLRAGSARAEGGHLTALPAGGCALRLTVACRTTSSEAFHRLVLRLEAAAPRLPPDVRLRISGAVPLLVRVQVLLVDTQLKSFALALLVVTLVLLVAYRAPRLALISLLPNVTPILFTLGAMGYLDVPLNTATVTVAGIALGLVVDDTIHLLHHHHHARQAGAGARAALASTLQVVGRPIATTTLAVAAGFGAFAASPFRPTHYFGLLIALTCLAALACDLVALPALLAGSAGREGGDAE